MTDIIFDYPKSSCSCWECNKFTPPLVHPINMYNDCYTKNPFKVQPEPVTKYGHIILNPGVIGKDKFDKTFEAINVKNCPSSACIGTTYSNSDPRLYNQGGSRLQLDTPPLNSSVKLSSLTTDKSLNRYGQGYKLYSDINSGQILYYISKDREDTFYKPLFSREAIAVGTLYKDPMGSIKPHYDRVPVEQYNPTKLCGESDKYCLSFMKDTQFHREDILSRQMSKQNRQRYEPRWTNVD
jgi:hypothetical protein